MRVRVLLEPLLSSSLEDTSDYDFLKLIFRGLISICLEKLTFLSDRL